MKSKSRDKHKHKKHKKEKHKEKSKKKEEKREKKSSESESESDEEEWMESVHQSKTVRDDWMKNEGQSFDDFIPTYSKNERGGERKRQRLQKSAAEKMLEKKILEERELNPYLKNEGSLRMMRPCEDDDDVKVLSVTVGDGGYSWLKKAYDRVKEQASSEGRTMEEVAVERWGSLEKLENMLNKAKQQVGIKDTSRSPSTKRHYKYGDKYRISDYSHHSDRNLSSSDYKKKMYDETYFDRKLLDTYKKPSRSYDDSSDHKRSDGKSTRRSYDNSPDHKHSDRKPSRSYNNSPDHEHSDLPRDTKRFLPPRDDYPPSWKKKKEDYRGNDSSSDKYGHSSWKKKDCEKGSSSSSEKYAWERDFEADRKKSDKCASTSLSVKSSSQPAWKKKERHKDSSALQKRFAKEGETLDHQEEIASCSKSDISMKEISEQEASCSKSEISTKEISVQEDKNICRESKLSEEDSDSEINAKKEALKDIIMNQNELNLLSARALRAEFCADFQLAEEIQNALDAAKTAKQNLKKSDSIPNEQPRGEVMEHLIDCYPLPKYLQKIYHKKRIRSNKVVQVGSFKKQYMDDSLSLKEMFQREKTTTADDQLRMYVDTAAAVKNSVNEDFTDDVSEKVSKKIEKYQQKEEKNIKKAIQDFERKNSALEKCRYCLDKPLLPKHTIVAKGNHVFLCVPPYTSLTEGHCFIIPNSHISSSLHFEENELSEFQAFKRGLTKMFGDENLDLVFMETSIHQRYFPHTIIECIPLPKETADMAPLYFKKGIDECEMEWSQNKKLIDLSKKGLRHSIPKGLPFFAVEFSFGGGFAHVIEDEKNFPKQFGKEIIGGMLEIDSHLILKAKNEPLDDLFKKTLKLIDKWWKYKAFFES